MQLLSPRRSEIVTKISIAYVIQSLGPGGAERQLVELATHLDPARFTARVLTYFPDDFYRPQLDRAGVSVITLARHGKWDLSPVWHLRRWLAAGEVDLIHAYLSSANLYAVAARQLTRRGAVIVSERSSPAAYSGWQARYRRWAMRRAQLVVANSAAAQRQIIEMMGLSAERVHFIPNGLDLARYHPIAEDERQAVRQRLGWNAATQYVLTVANYTAVKDHKGILAALVGQDASSAWQQFIWAGAPVPAADYQSVVEQIRAQGLTDRVCLLGARTDVIDLYRAADVLLLNSRYEGSPNVVLEALACGCPVVATDVSDVGRYVLPGETGWLIPPGDVPALRAVLRQVAQTEPAQLLAMGLRGREHIERLGLDSDALARRYEAVYSGLINSTPSGGAGEKS